MGMFDKATVGEWPLCADAAFAANLNGTAFPIVAGYLQSANAFHPWSDNDFLTLHGPKLPIYVANSDGRKDAEQALQQLEHLDVPFHKDIYVAYDLETRKDDTLVSKFSALMNHYGFRVLVYGSASTVFENPKCNGYWVADYLQTLFMYSHMGTRMTQCIEGELYDTSTVKPWIVPYFWK
jgi:hypothetical protein